MCVIRRSLNIRTPCSKVRIDPIPKMSSNQMLSHRLFAFRCQSDAVKANYSLSEQHRAHFWCLGDAKRCKKKGLWCWYANADSLCTLDERQR